MVLHIGTGLGVMGDVLNNEVAADVQALSTGDASAASQASTWQQNAAAWVDRLGQQYSAYRDIVQPVQVRSGCNLLKWPSWRATRTSAARLLMQGSLLHSRPCKCHYMPWKNDLD